MPKAEKKRIGRPMKAPIKGERVSLGLMVTAETKERIDKTARASGRTQSQEAEALIERAFSYDKILEAMGTNAERLREGVFRSAGYTAIHSPYGKIWVPKGYPLSKRSGWEE